MDEYKATRFPKSTSQASSTKSFAAALKAAPNNVSSQRVPSRAPHFRTIEKFTISHGHNQQANMATRGATTHDTTLTPRSQVLDTGRWPRRPLRMITDRADNAGIVAWRRNQPSLNQMTVSRTVIEVDDKKKALKYGASFPKLEHLGAATGTNIIPKKAQGDHVKLLFWGDQKGIDAAKAQIQQWEYEFGSKSQASAAWAKIWSLTPALSKRLEEKLAEDDRRQTFRQFPPEDSLFAAIGQFQWPENDFRPQEVLGDNYEALDPIRTACSSYIIFEPSTHSFRIMGSNADAVKTALLRVRRTYFQCIARQVGEKRLYLLQAKSMDTGITKVQRLLYQGPSIWDRGLHPVVDGHYVKGAGGTNGAMIGNTPRLKDQRTKTNARTMRDTTIRMLEKLQYYRGDLRMHARFGTFKIMKHRGSVQGGGWSVEDFERLLKDRQFEATVSQEIGDLHMEKHLYDRAIAADKLLAPSVSASRDLSDNSPTYSATFVIHNPDNTGHYCLEVDYKAVGPEFDQCSRKWTKLELGATTPNKLLEIPVIDLESGKAWTLEIVAAQAIDEDRLPSSYAKFAASVDIMRERASEHDISLCFTKYADMVPLVSYDQTIAWTYNLLGSEYEVEIAKNTHASLSKPYTSLVPQGQSRGTIYEARWSVKVKHSQWQQLLGPQATLEIGMGGNYSTDSMTWFPRDFNLAGRDAQQQDGFSNFLDKLEQVERMVRGEKVEREGAALQNVYERLERDEDLDW